MYYNTASNSFKAVDCDGFEYGVHNVTYGLASHPCRTCPSGMQTMPTGPSANHHATNGFNGPLACVTKPSHGLNGRSAAQCAAGSWNAGGNYDPCTPCGPGLSTVNDPAQQVSASACKTAIGFGFYADAVVPCPLGKDWVGSSRTTDRETDQQLRTVLMGAVCQ
jgi:hypothetical protein